MFALISDIQAMGESNSVFIRQPMISRDVLFAANTIYKSLHGADDGSVPATFRIIYMIGWKYSADQAKPLKRGSGQVHLKEALPTYEDEASKE
jgi:NADH dehydrogenase [ubiquinone] 1 alpha subcomplex assembly factor 5